MKYYLDCEFDGYQGKLISMALIRQDGHSMYAILQHKALDPWVRKNVMPIIYNVPINTIGVLETKGERPIHDTLRDFFADDDNIHVIADWPDDFKYLCECLIIEPGKMIDIPGITFTVERVDAYPSSLEGAIQHNAWWDAMALRHLIATKLYMGQIR